MSAMPEPHDRAKDRLIIPLLRSFVVGVAGLGLLLFLPAGTLNYWQAWVLIAVFVLGSNALGLYLAIHDPELLARRKQAGPRAETRLAQKIIISVLIVALIAMLVLSALDYRLGWSNVPALVSLAVDVFAALWLYITFLVVKENCFSVSDIKVIEDLKCICIRNYVH